MRVLENVQPQKYFIILRNLQESHTVPIIQKAISDYCMNFAKERN